jgi:hypothetical protein
MVRIKLIVAGFDGSILTDHLVVVAAQGGQTQPGATAELGS